MAVSKHEIEIGGKVSRTLSTPAVLPTDAISKGQVEEIVAASGGGGTSNIPAGAFTGELDVSGGNRYYDDYTSGAVVNLSLSATKVLGSATSVRIKGDLTGTIPADWNFSGQPITVNSAKLNELSLLYVNDGDTRIVNRIVDIGSALAPSTLTNLHLWYDGTDSSSMTLDGSNVSNLTDKAGSINLARIAGHPGPLFSTNKMVFAEGANRTFLDGSPSAVLAPDVDFHGFFIFKNNSSTQFTFIGNRTNSGDYFGIGMRNSNLGVGIIKAGAWQTSKGVPFSDQVNYHKLEFKNKAGVVTAFLDGVEMTATGTVFASGGTDLKFRIGAASGIVSTEQKAHDFKEFFVKSGEMTEAERNNMMAYISNKYGL